MITRCLYIEAKIKDAGCMFLISQDPFDEVHAIKSQDQESNDMFLISQDPFDEVHAIKSQDQESNATLFVLIRKETLCCKLVSPNSTKMLLIKTTPIFTISSFQNQ
jgi:hypothetical protein